jgi:hypothetical protein
MTIALMLLGWLLSLWMVWKYERNRAAYYERVARHWMELADECAEREFAATGVTRPASQEKDG